MLDIFYLLQLFDCITTKTPWSEILALGKVRAGFCYCEAGTWGLASLACAFNSSFPLLSIQGLPPKRWKAEVTHLSCPEPTVFAFSPVAPRWSSLREMWIPSFEQSKKEAQALRWLVDRNQNFSAQDFWGLVFKD